MRTLRAATPVSVVLPAAPRRFVPAPYPSSCESEHRPYLLGELAGALIDSDCATVQSRNSNHFSKNHIWRQKIMKQIKKS